MNNFDTFSVNIGDTFNDDKRNITITDRDIKKIPNKNRNTQQRYYQYKCNTCGGFDMWMLEYNLLTIKCNCSCCTGKTIIEGINDIPTTDPWMVKFFPGGYDEAKQYTYGSSKKINFVCPDCKKLKSKPQTISDLYRKHSIGCTCGDGFSYPEKFMNCILEQLNVNFEWHYRPNWLKGYQKSNGAKEFDFYLPEHKIIIEMDGDFGHGKYVHPKSGISLEESKAIDNWKDEQAKKQGLKIIRIDSDESNLDYLKKNITEQLTLFNLNNINWLQCDIDATKNKVKEVCEFYENNKPISAPKIGELLKINRNAIVHYLKKGRKFGWCTYDVQEALSQRKIKHIAQNIKI